MNLYDYINEAFSLNEAVRAGEVEKVIDLFTSYLKKRNIYVFKNTTEFTVDGQKFISLMGWNDAGDGFICNWSIKNTAEVDNIHFIKDFVNSLYDLLGGKSINSICSIKANGASHTQVLKTIELGVSNMSPKAIEKAIADAHIYEAGSELEQFLAGKRRKPGEPDLQFYVRVKSNLGVEISSARKKNPEKADYLVRMKDELMELINTLAPKVDRGGRISMQAELPEETELERATPEERFDDMNSYITSVIKGHKPLALLCGAPGVGKTYRVMEYVKKNLKPNQYFVIKGRCTPSALFMALWEHRHEGHILIFDDCDDVFKDDTAVNIIKAAYDSSDVRAVSWMSSKGIPMDVETATHPDNVDDAVFDEQKNMWLYPRHFTYNGGGIIITNFRAGQIDTAIRNRALIADLDFTTAEILDLVEAIKPHVMPGKLSEQAKDKALAYLRVLAESGADVEISIRSFTTCAIQYDSDSPEAAIERRIKEQMRLQSARGGKKY